MGGMGTTLFICNSRFLYRIIRFYPWWKWKFLVSFHFIFHFFNFFLFYLKMKWNHFVFQLEKLITNTLWLCECFWGMRRSVGESWGQFWFDSKNDKEKISLKIFRLWSFPSSKVIHRIFLNLFRDDGRADLRVRRTEFLAANCLRFGWADIFSIFTIGTR